MTWTQKSTSYLLDWHETRHSRLFFYCLLTQDNFTTSLVLIACTAWITTPLRSCTQSCTENRYQYSSTVTCVTVPHTGTVYFTTIKASLANPLSALRHPFGIENWTLYCHTVY